MLITIDPTMTVDHFFPEDRDPKTVWKLGTIDAKLFQWIQDDSGTTFLDEQKQQVEVHVKRHTRNLRLVKFGLKGWSELSSKAGTFPFSPDMIEKVQVPGVGEREGLKDAVLDRLVPFIDRLGEKILELNVLEPVNAENFAAPSR